MPSLIVNTNVTSLVAHRRLNENTTQVQRSLERISSGLKINRAADDAAGLSVSENLIGQVRGNQKALQNAQDGVSILQVAQGGLTVINNNLQRMRELAVQAGNDTNSQQQREAIAREIRAMAEDVLRIANSTDFNGIPLLDGSVGATANLQVGAGSDPSTNTINIASALGNVTLGVAGIGLLDSTGINATFLNLDNIFNLGTGLTAMTSSAVARSFMGDVDRAINVVTAQLATLGSYQNQLDSAITNLEISVESFSASNSRIRDLDVASESSVLVQSQILQEAAVQVLAQSNRIPQLTLSLLQN